MIKQTIYITGTDTDAGKTWVTSECLKALCSLPIKAIGMKPVASGCVMTGDGLRNDDALKLMAAGAISLPYQLINPIALRDATAPEIAAGHEGIEIFLEPIIAAHHQVQTQADVILVEGVGGWMAPLSDKLEQSDLVRALNCPVILVVGLKLGCINHARLTIRALKADGVNCLGWIVAQTDPDLLFTDDYFDALQRCITIPLLGRVFANIPSQLDKFVALIKTDAT